MILIAEGAETAKAQNFTAAPTKYKYFHPASWLSPTELVHEAEDYRAFAAVKEECGGNDQQQSCRVGQASHLGVVVAD